MFQSVRMDFNARLNPSSFIITIFVIRKYVVKEIACRHVHPVYMQNQLDSIRAWQGRGIGGFLKKSHANSQKSDNQLTVRFLSDAKKGL